MNKTRFRLRLLIGLAHAAIHVLTWLTRLDQSKLKNHLQSVRELESAETKMQPIDKSGAKN